MLEDKNQKEGEREVEDKNKKIEVYQEENKVVNNPINDFTLLILKIIDSLKKILKSSLLLIMDKQKIIPWKIAYVDH